MLEVNNNHKKIDPSFINTLNKKKITTTIGSLILSVVLLSGCKSMAVEESYDTPNTKYKVEDYKNDEDVVETVNTVSNVNISSIDELNDIEKIDIILEDNYNYDFLNMMPNLKELNLLDNTSNRNVLKNIDGSIFDKGITITIKSDNYSCLFNEEKYGFLKDIPEIERLSLGVNKKGLFIDSDYVQSLKNVSRLELGITPLSNFNYKDLTYLKSLYIYMEVYDIPMYFTKQNIDELMNAGVNVYLPDDYKQAYKFDEEINEIIDSLDIKEDDTDLDKINKVIAYVVNEYEYDEEVLNYLEKNDKPPEELRNEFYKDGILKSHSKESQICGNYAALTYTLLKRLDVDVYNLHSDGHVWNAVRLDDDIYYIDSTYIDTNYHKLLIPVFDKESHKAELKEGTVEILNSGDQEKINNIRWYMEDPSEVMKYETEFGITDHIPEVVSPDLELKEIPDQQNIKKISDPNYNTNKFIDLIDEEYEIEYNAYKKAIGLGVAIGILTGLGVGFLARNVNHDDMIKEQEEKKRRR